MIATIAISALTGGLAGAIATNFFTIWRDKRNRLLSFRCELDVLLGQMPDEERSLHAFRDRTRDQVRDLCFAARQDIKQCRRKDFMAARAAYCDAPNPAQEAFVCAVVQGGSPKVLRPPMRETMTTALQHLIDLAK